MHLWQKSSEFKLSKYIISATLSVVFWHFSLLSHRILHLVCWTCMTTRCLFPLWFAWRIASGLLLQAIAATSHQIVVHALSLSHHSSEATGVWQHFILASNSGTTSNVGRYNVILGLLLRGMKILILRLVLLAILLLAFNIYWWLGSDSILWRSWTWLLRVSSVLFHHLSLIHPLGSIMRNSTTH